MRLKPQFVPRLGDVNDYLWETLRVLRNACASGLTHDQREISPEQQRVYRLRCSENTRHYLYWNADAVVVAFSRLEWRADGFVYPTYGVDPAHRGKGYAWEVVQHAMLAAGGPLRGDLLVSNKAIMKVDFTLGWEATGPAVDGVLPVEAPWPPKGVRLFDPREFSGGPDDVMDWATDLAIDHDDQMQHALDEIVRYSEEK